MKKIRPIRPIKELIEEVLEEIEKKGHKPVTIKEKPNTSSCT